MARRTPSLSLEPPQQVQRPAKRILKPTIIKPVRRLTVDDLFAGVGGASTGFVAAALDEGCTYDLTAINHWELAVKVHHKNHPEARALCERIEAVDPRVLHPDGVVDFLLAGPECIYHSNARGGRPINDQKRASAWQVLRWMELVLVKNCLIENVPEFRNWGPLEQLPCKKCAKHGSIQPKCKDCLGSGKAWYPIKSRRGEIFKQYIATMRSFGYTVEWKVLCCADYGDATTRRRLFIQARLGNQPIVWPEQTHSKIGPDGKPTVPGTLPWRAAKEIIDWSLRGKDMLNRKKAHARKAWLRVADGLLRYNGINIFPVVEQYDLLKLAIEGDKTARRKIAKIPIRIDGSIRQKFLLKYYGTGKSASLDEPLGTIPAQGLKHAICEPYILPNDGPYNNGTTNGTKSIRDPLNTITSRGGGRIVEPSIDLEPVLTDLFGSKDAYPSRSKSVREPLPTVPTGPRWTLVEGSFTLAAASGGVARPTEEPLPTIVTAGGMAIVTLDFEGKDEDGPRVGAAFVDCFGEKKGQRPRSRSVMEPVNTVTTAGSSKLTEAFLTEYYGRSKARTVREPIGTITTKDRFGLVVPDLRGKLRLRLRMLVNPELARATGLDDYDFIGPEREVTKMIGNAWPVRTGRAVSRAMISTMEM